MRLPKRLACGVTAISALLFLSAAAAALAQDSPPPAAAAPSPPQTSAQPPASSPAAPPTAVLDATPPPPVSHGKHTVTVTFDYDFGQTPACSKKITFACVQQFIAYDISAGMKHATMLFPIPLPPVTKGAVHGITATSPLLDFESGKHLISVSAMAPNGTHSKKNLCTTWITIP